MELSPQRLIIACGALFAGVVALNFLEQYRSNSQFREKFAAADFSGFRARLRQEEGLSDAPELEQPSVWPTADIASELDLSDLTSEPASGEA